MRHLKFGLLLLLTVCLTFSCKKDDDGDAEPPQQTTAELIIGTWRWTASVYNGVNEPLSECDLLDTITIEASTLSGTSHDSNTGAAACNVENIEDISYMLSGNTIIFTFDGEVVNTIIESVDDTKLIIKDEEDGDVYLDTYTKQ